MRIGVILPERYRGGTLRGALNIARMLRLGALACGDQIEVSFGHVDDRDLYAESDFADLSSAQIARRPFSLERIPAPSLAPYLSEWFGIDSKVSEPSYVIFNDGISNFEDCDFWLLVSDRVPGPLPPHRPYAVVIYDYIQRYVPEIFGKTEESDANWLGYESYAALARAAQFVVCTTHQTRRDCISFAGARSDRVMVFPMEFDPLHAVGEDGALFSSARPYLLWTTNTTEHKNHINVIKGLELYFAENPDSDLDVCISGVLTELFSIRGEGRLHFDHPYIARVRKLLEESTILRDRVSVLGNLSDLQYVARLRGAALCLHAAKYDNGTYSVLEAAWHGVPSLSSDYPAMREMAARFRVPLTFFDSHDPRSLAANLRTALLSRAQACRNLPTRDALSEFSFDAVAPEYWKRFKAAIEKWPT